MSKHVFKKSIVGETLAEIVQNPQPVIFSQAMDVDAGTTSPKVELVTEMGAPESMKIYSIMAYVIPSGTQITVNDSYGGSDFIPGTTAVYTSGYTDLDLSIFVASNRVPHRQIDLAVIDASNDKEIVMPTPIFVEWSQRLYIQVQNNDPQAAGTQGDATTAGSLSRVKITLIGEIVDEVELRRRLERQKGQ